MFLTREIAIKRLHSDSAPLSNDLAMHMALDFGLLEKCSQTTPKVLMPVINKYTNYIKQRCLNRQKQLSSINVLLSRKYLNMHALKVFQQDNYAQLVVCSSSCMAWPEYVTNN